MIRVSQPGRPALENIHAETMAERAATEPTDKSMPEVTMTKVIPKAIIATTAAWIPILMIFGTVRNTGVAINRAIQRIIRPTRAP
jgi:hypothetical protein